MPRFGLYVRSACAGILLTVVYAVALPTGVAARRHDWTAPTVSITSPAAGAQVSGNVTITAAASDTVGVAGVQFKVDGVNLGSRDNYAPYSASWNTSTAAAGTHTLTAVAQDTSGNTRTSAAVTVTVGAAAPPTDTTPPVISAVTASSVTSSGATIAWTTNEASDSQVEYGSTTAYGSTSTPNPALVTTHSTALSLSANTLYHFRVRSRDAAGNLATSGDFTLTTAAVADTTPPTVSISAPAAGTTVKGSVTVTVGASDNVGVVGVLLQLNGTNLGAEMTTAPFSGTWNTTSATDGSHTLTAVARDAAGNRKTSAGVTVTVANNALPPPPGGIASHYPGDVGIENDPAVVFVEHFNESTLTALFNQWGDVLNGSAMSLVSDAPAGSPYPHSLNIPWVGGGVNDGGHLYKVLSPGVDDTLYVRYYVKYPTNGTPHHSGIQVGGYNPPSAWPDPHAGEKPAGNDRFLAGAEQLYNLGSFDHYDYWMGMHADSGGTYWGDFLLNNPKVQATRGQWMCVEEMVKLNNPVSALNGEHAIWLNGVKVSHLGQGFPNGTWSGGIFTQNPSGTPFAGFQWRNDPNLNINWLWLQNYAPDDPAGFSSTMRYAHVVAAKSYVGCLAQ